MTSSERERKVIGRWRRSGKVAVRCLKCGTVGRLIVKTTVAARKIQRETHGGARLSLGICKDAKRCEIRATTRNNPRRRSRLLAGILLLCLCVSLQACFLFPGFNPAPSLMNTCDLWRVDIADQLEALAHWDFDNHSEAELFEAWGSYEDEARNFVNAGCVY